jgi:hypothetical protein
MGILSSKQHVYCDSCFDRKHKQAADRATKADEKIRASKEAREKNVVKERAMQMDYTDFLDNFRNNVMPGDVTESDYESESECESNDDSEDEPKKESGRNKKSRSKKKKKKDIIENMNKSHRNYRIKLCTISGLSVGKEEIEEATGVKEAGEALEYNRPNWDENRKDGEINMDCFAGDSSKTACWLENCGLDDVMIEHIVTYSEARRRVRLEAQMSNNNNNKRKRTNGAESEAGEEEEEHENFNDEAQEKRRGRPSENTTEESKRKYEKKLNQPITEFRVKRYLAAVTFCGVRRFKSREAYFRAELGVEDPRGCVTVSAR